MYAFLGRISRAYNDISGLLIEWSEQCEQFWVYQHDADDKIATTHCHIFALNSKRDAEGLKKLVSWKRMKFSGNKDSSFKSYNKIHDIEHQGWYDYIKYMSKGNLDPVYYKGEHALEIATESKSHWENNSQEQSPQEKPLIQDKKTKRVTQFDIARLAQSMYMEKYTEEVMGKSYLEFNVAKLVKIVTSLLKCNRMTSNYRVVAGIIQDIQVELDPDRYLKKILSMV